MFKKAAITILVAVLSCAAFSESQPKYGWKERPTEKFELSNRAERKLSLVILPIGASDNAMIDLRMTSEFPVNMSVQNARGDTVNGCRYTGVRDLQSHCSLRWDGRPKYIVIEDANQAGLSHAKNWADALNRVNLTISDYTCVKHCAKLR
jgi:hypothetical protein